MKDLLQKYLPAFDKEDGAGGGGEADADKVADDAKSQDDAGDDQGNGDGADEAKQATDKQDSADDADKSDGEKGKDKTDQPETIALEVPKEFEEFTDEFQSFSSDMDAWVKANPEAKTHDVLAEAARRQAELVKQSQKEQIDARDSQVEAWEKEAQADKVIGGDDFEKNVETAKKAINAFVDDDLKKVLEDSGLGSHPSLIRLAFEAGKSVSEAETIKPAKTSKGGTLTEALYG